MADKSILKRKAPHSRPCSVEAHAEKCESEAEKSEEKQPPGGSNEASEKSGQPEEELTEKGAAGSGSAEVETRDPPGEVETGEEQEDSVGPLGIGNAAVKTLLRAAQEAKDV